jgi:pilus assembly protein Flp/PilA
LPPGQNISLTEITRRINLKNFNLLLNKFISDESGQDLIEYALIASLIALGAVAVLGPLSTAINKAYSDITTALGSA